MNETESYRSYLRSPYRSIKHNTYFEAYDDLFSRYRNREVTFVEIGVLGGGSLFMWRDFFGPKARIIGVDLNPNAKKWEKDGFEIFIGSQSDENFWKKFKEEVGSVDVVLDDGGHTYHQQITTVEMLLEIINEDGMLVVEDVHTSYMDGFGPRKYSFVEYTKLLMDRMGKRFGELSDAGCDRRVWSIQIYESIVAFRINRKASGLASRPTDNGASDDAARDFRDVASARESSVNSPLIRRLNWLRWKFPVFRKSRVLNAFTTSARAAMQEKESVRALRKYF